MANTISEIEYKILRAKIDAYDVAAKTIMDSRHTNFLAREDQANLPSSPANEERSSVELYEFVANPPETYVAYVQAEPTPTRYGYPHLGTLTTWTGDKLGSIVFGPSYRSNFGGTRVPIAVKAINGKEYYGTYYKSSGDYCRIKAKKVKG